MVTFVDDGMRAAPTGDGHVTSTRLKPNEAKIHEGLLADLKSLLEM